MGAAASVLTLSALGLLAFCVLAEVGQQLCFKAGSDRVPDGAGAVRGALAQPLIWAGIALWAVEVVAWIMVLHRAPLSVAYPVMTLVYVGVPLGGALLLGERMSARQISGAALIAAGVFCVALSGGAP